MKIKITFYLLSVFFLSGCATLLTENDSRLEEEGSSYVGANKNRVASFNLNQKKLPTTFQTPNRARRPNILSIMTPLHLTHIEGNTWRTAANPAIVYGIMSRLLSQNYIISSVDRKNLSVQTDWDKFFIDGRLFRNRMSINVFPVSSRQTEVVIKNSVEYYSGNVGQQEQNMSWLPSPDLTDEVKKLVENTDKQTTFAYSQNY